MGRRTAKRLTIFHHIPKTAGTAMRQVLRRNYGRFGLAEPYGPGRDSVQWYREYLAGLGFFRRRTLRCVSAHSAHYLLPLLEPDCDVFTVLRHPVDRVVSLFHFVTDWQRHGDGRGASVGRIITERQWSLEDIYRELGSGCESDSETHELFKYFFDGQARAIAAPWESTAKFRFGEDDGGALTSLASDVVARLYTVGLQDRMEESLELFARRYGWKSGSRIERVNVTRERPRLSDLSAETADLVARHNRADTVLYERALSEFGK